MQGQTKVPPTFHASKTLPFPHGNRRLRSRHTNPRPQHLLHAPPTQHWPARPLPVTASLTLNVHVHHDHGFHTLVGNPDDPWMAGGWWWCWPWWGSSFC